MEINSNLFSRFAKQSVDFGDFSAYSRRESFCEILTTPILGTSRDYRWYMNSMA